jgi:hypothetical protein
MPESRGRKPAYGGATNILDDILVAAFKKNGVRGSRLFHYTVDRNDAADPETLHVHKDLLCKPGAQSVNWTMTGMGGFANAPLSKGLGTPFLSRRRLRLHSLQSDLRFKMSMLVRALTSINRRLRHWPVKKSRKFILRDANSLNAMCCHTWRGLKQNAAWVKQLGITMVAEAVMEQPPASAETSVRIALTSSVSTSLQSGLIATTTHLNVQLPSWMKRPSVCDLDSNSDQELVPCPASKPTTQVPEGNMVDKSRPKKITQDTTKASDLLDS